MPWAYLNFNKISASDTCELLGCKVELLRTLQALAAVFIINLSAISAFSTASCSIHLKGLVAEKPCQLFNLRCDEPMHSKKWSLSKSETFIKLRKK